jgi:hypothetical protein
MATQAARLPTTLETSIRQLGMHVQQRAASFAAGWLLVAILQAHAEHKKRTAEKQEKKKNSRSPYCLR